MIEHFLTWVETNSILKNPNYIDEYSITNNKDSCYVDIFSKKNIGRIVVWEDNDGIEFEVLSIQTEKQLYYSFFDEKHNLDSCSKDFFRFLLGSGIPPQE